MEITLNDILGYLRNHPGSTADEVSKGINRPGSRYSIGQLISHAVRRGQIGAFGPNLEAKGQGYVRSSRESNLQPAIYNGPDLPDFLHMDLVVVSEATEPEPKPFCLIQIIDVTIALSTIGFSDSTEVDKVTWWPMPKPAENGAPIIKIMYHLAVKQFGGSKINSDYLWIKRQYNGITYSAAYKLRENLTGLGVRWMI